MARFVKYGPAAISALLVLASFPPFHLALLVFVALIPWLTSLKSMSGKQAFRSGMVFGFIFWLGELYFVGALASHWTGSVALAAIPYLLGCALGSLYFALFGWLAHLCYKRDLIWAIPVVWAGVEIFRSYIFGLAFPFGLLASPLSIAPVLMQSAHFGSIFFTSAWVALLSVIGAQLMHGKGYREVRWLALSFFFLLVASITRFAQPIQGEPRRLVAGQTGVDLAFGDQSTVLQRIAAVVDEIQLKSKGADLLVLPEGIVRGGDGVPPLIGFTPDPTLPIVFGGQRGEAPAHQSAYSYDGTWHYADKTRLVIFGEYVPGRDWIPFLDKFKLPGGDLIPGDQVSTLQVGKFRVGGLLCFEGLFPDVAYKQAVQGANILAVMAIDDWYLGTNAPEQLRDGSNWRAVETGLPVVRAASLGYTVVIDARGQTVAQAPLREPNALGATVTVPAEPQYFPLFPVFPLLSLLSLLAVPAYDLLLRRKERQTRVRMT